MREKLEALRALLEKEQTEVLIKKYPSLTPEKANIKTGIKYVRVDIGHSGRYMVEISTGNIFGIKAYGVIHRGYRFGNLDTINEWYWGEYRAFKRPSPSRS